MPPVKLDDLKSIRKALGKSQWEMADLVGCSLRAIQSYEQGWRQPPASVLKLAALLLFLDWQKDHRKQPPCWQTKNCPPEVRDDCPAYQYRVKDVCWLVSGNKCGGQKLKSWRDKLNKCSECEVMQEWLSA